MKKNIFNLLIVFVILLPYLSYANYNDNYQEGYQQGYTYNPNGLKGLPPLAPLTPLQRIGETDQDAYTRGILDGRRAKRNRDNVIGTNDEDDEDY